MLGGARDSLVAQSSACMGAAAIASGIVIGMSSARHRQLVHCRTRAWIVVLSSYGVSGSGRVAGRAALSLLRAALAVLINPPEKRLSQLNWIKHFCHRWRRA